MKTDKYTKVVLTITAAALIWLCLWGPGPKWGTPAHAEGGSNVMAVNIAQVGGKTIEIPFNEQSHLNRPLRGVPTVNPPAAKYPSLYVP